MEIGNMRYFLTFLENNQITDAEADEMLYQIKNVHRIDFDTFVERLKNNQYIIDSKEQFFKGVYDNIDGHDYKISKGYIKVLN